jgi:hypothetical protein
VLFRDVCGREHPFSAVQRAQCEGWLETHAVYVITNVLFVSLLYDTLKMVTRVLETCQCHEQNCSYS